MGCLDAEGDDDEGGIMPRKLSKLGVVDVVTELGPWVAWAIAAFEMVISQVKTQHFSWQIDELDMLDKGPECETRFTYAVT